MNAGANPVGEVFSVLGSLSVPVGTFVLRLIVAVIIFLVGWIIAVAIGKLITQIVRAIKVDEGLKSVGAEEVFSRAGLRLDTGAFFGGLVRWFFIIVFLIAAVDVFELNQVTSFLESVAAYIPNVVVAAIILVAASLIASAVQKIVISSAKAAQLPSSALFGGIAKWSIWIFAILVALEQLGIKTDIISTLMTGVIGMVAIAGGIAFGLGGKDHASRFLDRLQRDIKED